MRKNNLAFIDTETTGFEIERHEIVQIGCVVVRQVERDGKGPEVEVIEEFELKVKPTHIETADRGALKVNGYNSTEWADALTLKQALEVLAEKTKDAIMVGHNVAFDYAFLKKAFEDQKVANAMHYHKIDTISFAFALLYDNLEVEKFSLRALCEYFKIENKNAHTALSDARATFELYKKLLGLSGLAAAVPPVTAPLFSASPKA
ncbi:3'-5' exonuclease [Candidatus Parcubacteria bacterium]|nr:3'-5' exonuclease [Candidatus Parcubacteria bacterium]